MERGKTNRRNFIRTLFIGSGALLMPSVVFGTASNGATGISSSASDNSNLVRQAVEAFYMKKYAEAEMYYKQLIDSEPDNISYYDGLRKVYHAQQKLFAAAQLYKQGLDANPSQAAFYDRLARSVKSIAMGNEKEEKMYKGKFGNEDLLLAALGIYIAAIPKFPGDKPLLLGLKDTATSFDVRNAVKKLNNKLPVLLTASIKNYLASVKDERGKPEDAGNLPVDDKISSKLSRMESKKRRVLYFDNEKENRQTAMSKQKKQWKTLQVKDTFASGDISKAKGQIEKILKDNPKETDLIDVLKKQAKKNKDKDIIVAFYKEQYKNKKDFWTVTGYATALRKQEKQRDFTNILSLYNEAETLSKNSGKEIDALAVGRALACLEAGKFAECRETVLKALEKTGGCGNISQKLSVVYAKSYAEEGNDTAAFLLLNLMKGETEEDGTEEINNEIVKYLKPDPAKDEAIYSMQSLFPYKKTKTDKLNILYAIAKIQNKRGDTEALRQTLDEIKAIDANNQFVLKYA